MSTYFEIPLRPSQPQAFTITLAGVTYGMFLQWRDLLAQCWLLDLLDSNGNTMIAGIPLVTGANLMAQYPDVDIGGQLWVATDGNSDATPTFDNLGVDSHLYFVVP